MQKLLGIHQWRSDTRVCSLLMTQSPAGSPNEFPVPLLASFTPAALTGQIVGRQRLVAVARRRERRGGATRAAR